MEMEKNKEEKKKLPTSFTTGAIALIFLATGYQTALFVIRASKAGIEERLDRPDTVFVYMEAASGGAEHEGIRSGDTGYRSGGSSPEIRNNPGYTADRSSSGSRGDRRYSGSGGAPEKASSTEYRAGGKIERRNSAHSPAAQQIRAEALSRRPPENFPFDPNTATTEDFVRLGFTEKQAQAIDRYRQAGGRFRRKEDFARSYVVEDSVYSRLEQWIRIPKTDINKADSAAFDALPGIGPYFASKMVSYRKRLHGYSNIEQLLDIQKFDKDRFDKIAELIEVVGTNPYPLWTLPEDSLKLHPYIGRHSAHGIVLFRENNPQDKLTVSGLAKAGIISEEQAAKLSRCVIAEP